MTNYFKIKKHWILTIGMVLCAMVAGAQELSDQEIGFDVARMKVSLKEHGVADQDLDREITMMREQYKYMHQVTEKSRNEILQKIKSEQKAQATANSTLDASIIPDTERAALKALYDATDGPHWKNTLENNRVWDVNNPNADISTWFGVIVINGHVVRLYLENNNLNGSIPPEMGLLSKLEQLYLASNKLVGTIPMQIGELTKLFMLSIYNNQLVDSIPPEIGQLSELAFLYLFNNKLSGIIPIQIGRLTKLKSFEIANNQIEGSIPSEMIKLTELTGISINFNQLSGNIPDLINLTLLNYLSFGYNKFRFIDFTAQYPIYKNIASFLYQPQSKTDTEKTITGTSGGSLTLTMCEDGRYIPNVDTFQWFKDGVAITNDSVSNRSITLSNLTAVHAGNYYCLSKNPQITDPIINGQNLILERQPIHLSVLNCPTRTGEIKITSVKLTASEIVNFAFQNTTSSNAIVSYYWTIADAANTKINEGTNTTGTYSYVFATAGNYTVTVEVTDGNGCKSSFPKTVTIGPAVYCKNKPISFTFETLETITNYKWVIKKSTGEPVNETSNVTGLFTYTFGAPGSYVVSLEATGTSGCYTPFSAPITVTDCDFCVQTNPNAAIVKNLFIELLNKLQSMPEGTIPNGYRCPELLALKPYITIPKRGIYNYNHGSFSFSNDANNTDVSMVNDAPVTAVNLDKFINSEVVTNFTATYGNLNKESTVKHINFCPDKVGVCENHIAIVVDESGSIDESEARKIRAQLNFFLQAQAEANRDLKGNMYISLIGMSNSDSDSRGDHVLELRVMPGDLLKDGAVNRWIENYGRRYGTPGVSAGSDYWKSGLDKVFSPDFKIKPELAILITDGCQTADPVELKKTMDKYDNYQNSAVSSTYKPHLYVIGIDNGFYVDNVYSNKALARNEDPNYVTSLQKTNTEASKTNTDISVASTFLGKSLKYLFNYNDTEFPIARLDGFETASYYAHNDFSMLSEEKYYFSDNIVNAGIGCGEASPKNYCADCLSFQPEIGTEYLLSAWVKEETNIQLKTYENTEINVVFYNNPEAADLNPADPNAPTQIISTVAFQPSGDIIEGWQRIVGRFMIPAGTVTAGVALINKNLGIPVYFDDFRIQPSKGSVKSFVYDPETFKLMSELDENNYSTFYEYDKEGGLVRVKKETAKGIKTIQETRSGSVINTN